MKSIAHGDRCVNRSSVWLVAPADQAVVASPALAAPTDLRADLAAANERLNALRRSQPTQHATPQRVADVCAMPEHLGWGSLTVAAYMRQFKSPRPQSDRCQTQQSTLNRTLLPPTSASVEETDEQPFDNGAAGQIHLYPTIAVALLKSEQAATGRIWLLARHLDEDGRGWIGVDHLRERLTRRSSRLRVVGWRRLRQLLKGGEGHFWRREVTADGRDRLWLFGWRRVCRTLSIGRLYDERVSVPVESLLGKIGALRSALYATFHAGRSGMPISRQTLATVTGVCERSQRTYDKRWGVDIRPNFALTSPYSSERQREQTYQATTPHFTFTDHRGHFGVVGKQYNARQLPNSYSVSWQRSPSAQKRKLNKRLKQDLAQNGTQGNSYGQWERAFAANGRDAARLTNGGFIHDNGKFWIPIC